MLRPWICNLILCRHIVQDTRVLSMCFLTESLLLIVTPRILSWLTRVMSASGCGKGLLDLGVEKTISLVLARFNFRLFMDAHSLIFCISSYLW